MRAFETHPRVASILTVIHPDDEHRFREAAGPKARFVHGGADRQASVLSGLTALQVDPLDFVLIHDGARPFVSHATIDGVLAALEAEDAPDGAIAALPVSDTLKRGAMGRSTGTAPRDDLWRAQTPQGFAFPAILAAHREAAPGRATDDASVIEERGGQVVLVPDAPTNIKLTFPGDFAMAEALLAANEETRVGFGYDVHAFTDGDAVTIGGIVIAHSHSLAGHSDADVALHSITDALYGALGEGDIGRHFPPSDPHWRGADSRVFLRHAASLLAERGGRISSADVTIICEAPKIAPHADRMRDVVAECLGCEASRVSVKATTTEGLGFQGRREGIAAQAVCAVRLPTARP